MSPFSRLQKITVSTVSLLASFAPLGAQTAPASGPDLPSPLSDLRAARGGAVSLDRLVVSDTAFPSTLTPYVAPQTVRSITTAQIDETINALDTEDAVKFLPSLFLRKRNNGDTQAVLASRVWGVSSSARSLVYADGLLLSALIANNNSIGGPRWGLVAPAEIERIDVLYGPFSAAYAGNSMGAVMEITTRAPAKFTATLAQTEAVQSHSLYGTRDTFLTHQTAVTVGDRRGAFSYWFSANYQDGHSQPLSYVTSATFPAGTTGGYAARNKLGAAANLLGSSGLLHTRMTNAKLKLGYDLSPTLRGTYTLGLWRNRADSTVETYLRDATTGAPTFKGLAGFASGNYHLEQDHSTHSIAVVSDTKTAWDFSATLSAYYFDRDTQRLPTIASATGTTFGPAGRLVSLTGTDWFNADVKATWRPAFLPAAHVVSLGLHEDGYSLYNPTSATAEWTAGAPTSVTSRGDGKTLTQAAWLQDALRLTPTLALTVGARAEKWRAYDGINFNTATLVTQPRVERTNLSPKAVLTWSPALNPHLSTLSSQPSALSSSWTLTASVARAYRYATPAELFQLVTTGTTFTAPNPDLRPDRVLASELRIERATTRGRVQLALFQDDIHDAIVSQFLPLVAGSTQLYSYLSNVDHVRARGVELVVEQRDVLLRGLDFSGSVTFLDARTLALSGRASATAPASAAIGKKLPNIPDRRATFLVTYRFDPRWSVSLGGRYSDKLWTTLDNADVNPNTYQGFSSWFVADARVHCRVSDRVAAGLGVENLLNREYFLFHPFPQRTVVADVKLTF